MRILSKTRLLQTRAYAYIILAGILWGIIGIFFTHLSAAGFTHTQIVFLRVSTAALGLAAAITIRSPRLFSVRWRDLWCFVGTGIVSLLFFNICYFTAIQHTGLSIAAVLLYTAPMFVTLLSAWLFREKITRNKVIALLLMFSGCIFVTGFISQRPESLSVIGIIAGLGSGLGYALYSIFGRYALLKGYHSLTLTFYTFLFASLGCIPFLNFSAMASLFTSEWIFDALGIGIVCCLLPYLFYTQGLRGVENSMGSMLATIEPVVATIVGIGVYHESLTVYSGLGCAFIFAGIVVMSLGTRASRAKAPAPKDARA